MRLDINMRSPYEAGSVDDGLWQSGFHEGLENKPVLYSPTVKPAFAAGLKKGQDVRSAVYGSIDLVQKLAALSPVAAASEGPILSEFAKKARTFVKGEA